MPATFRNTLVAAFEDRVEAERAVDELEQMGFKGGSGRVRAARLRCG